MAWTVYLARCGDGTLYTGVTTDPERRLAEHNAGCGGAYTRARAPVTLVYWEPAHNRSGALRREYAIKRLTRSQKEDLVAAYLRLARRSDPV
jgi:putative endonuclease